ncbi:MAG: carbonic anhydrase [Deltaproteobacteria bacterium]|nr:carbonic anhydrase [Deltaproteobacteria bacterium]
MRRSDPPPSLSAEDALARLAEGNRRFRTATTTRTQPWSEELARAEQRPFAIVLGCSDARAPVEIVFDQGLGDLFVVRIAGNIVAPSIVGSIEFAASQFGSRLVVVMGHTDCGAVTATLRAMQAGLELASRNIRSITDRIAPHLEPLHREERSEDLLREAVRANVRASADHLRHGSRVLEDLVLAGRILVVGAEHELETGVVRFFDGVPEALRSRLP